MSEKPERNVLHLVQQHLCSMKQQTFVRRRAKLESRCPNGAK